MNSFYWNLSLEENETDQVDTKPSEIKIKIKKASKSKKILKKQKSEENGTKSENLDTNPKKKHRVSEEGATESQDAEKKIKKIEIR